MIEELDTLNRGLEKLVEVRTTALREREAQLKAQNLRFEAAVNNMSQALLMFDGDRRLVICNERYRRMYGLSREVVKPGCTLRDLLEHRKAIGHVRRRHRRNTSTEMFETLATGTTMAKLVDLPDGRTIAVLNHPMADGGWVATHDDITERQRAEQQIAHMARHDALTDLPNRVLFRERLAEALAGVSRGSKLAVLYLDLDRFKGVNDTLGHPMGDELLKVVAGRLRHCVRETDTVARVGGDEFAIIQAGIEQPLDTATLARRIGEAVRAPYDLAGHAVVVDTSIGIAIAPNDGAEPDGLLKAADMALYGAKADGRGTYRFFEAGDGHAHEGAARARDRAAPGAGSRRIRAALPAAGQRRRQADHRLRGAAALEPSRARHDPAGRVHPGRGGDRPDRAARRMGAAQGLHRCGVVARRHQGRGQPVADPVDEPEPRAGRGQRARRRRACRRGGWRSRSRNRC